MQERATAGHAGFQDAVRLEVRQAYYQFDAAQQQVKVARGAIAQADESLRINQNRYEGGLSTVTDYVAGGRSCASRQGRLLAGGVSHESQLRRSGTGDRHVDCGFSGGDAMRKHD